MTDGLGTRSFCRNREADKHKFGYCQQGLSVAFSKDSKYLVYGAPGAYDWKGTAKLFFIDNVKLHTYSNSKVRSIEYYLATYHL